MEPAEDLDACGYLRTLKCCICHRLLTEPMQLDCLHNCCRRCEELETAREGSHGCVTCPACRHATDAGTLAANRFLDRELRLHIALRGTGLCDFCIEYGEAGTPPVAWCVPCGKSLCDGCAVGHSRFAITHATRTLDDLRSESRGVRPPVETADQCPEHEEPYQYGCLTCEKELCSCCKPACVGASHDVHNLRSSPFEHRVKKVSESVLLLNDTVLEKLTAIRSLENLASRVDAVHADHLDHIKKRKNLVLEAVERAYDEVERAADCLYNRLRSDALDADSTIAALERQADDAHSYCCCMLEANATCDLLNQGARLCGRLEWLCTEIDRVCHLPSPVDGLRNVLQVPDALPDNVEDVIKQWIGIPHLQSQQSDERNYAEATAEQAAADATSSSAASGSEATAERSAADVIAATAASSSKTTMERGVTDAEVASAARSSEATTERAAADVAAAASVTSSENTNTERSAADSASATTPARLRLGRASVIVRLPIVCWDMAVTADGCRMLLAADAVGLLECSTRGQQLGGWRPPKRTNGQPDAVSTVQVLDDGRVAVGVRYSRLIVLLRRKAIAILATSELMLSTSSVSATSATDDTWIEDHRLPTLQTPPWRLAVRGGSLALAECRFDRHQRTWVSGRVVRLLVLPASDGASPPPSPPTAAVATQSREYDVWGLALTDCLIVTTSGDVVRLATGRLAHVVDAYSRVGRDSPQRLWRYATGNDEGLEGICSDTSGRVLYLAACKRNESGGRVMTVSADDGSELHSKLLQFNGGSLLPVWPSMHRATGGEQPAAVLAVVCYDSTTEQTRTVLAYPAVIGDSSSTRGC